MKKEITETEWELIQALRNYRSSYHNISAQLEIFIDTLVEILKSRDN